MKGLSVLSLAFALLAFPGMVQAQQREFSAYQAKATRAELEALLQRFENAARSRAYSSELRARARSEAEIVRTRLREGDFKVGDRILVMVENEPTLSDTFMVRSGGVLPLPVVGEVSVQGLLRSELDEHLTSQISRIINEPVVRSTAFLRLMVTGEVTVPGYYLVPTEAPLGEAVMVVQPTLNSRLSKLRIERAGERIWEGERLQVAIGEGRTLTELGLRSGDTVIVPGQPPFAPSQLAQNLVIVSTLIFAVSQILIR